MPTNCENGLKVHMSRMHSRIDQLDGPTDDCFNDEKYAGLDEGMVRGRLPKLHCCL